MIAAACDSPAMPDAPKDVVERFYEFTNRGLDVEEWLDAVVELADPEVEYVNPPDALAPGTRRGLEGFRVAFRSVREGFEVVHIEAEKMLVREDRVAVRLKVRIRGSGSGIEMDPRPWSHLWTIRDSRIVRFEWFRDGDAALTWLEQHG